MFSYIFGLVTGLGLGYAHLMLVKAEKDKEQSERRD